MKTKITKLKETGFCYGVKRAIEILERSAAESGPVQCLGEVVHNPQVIQSLQSRGVDIVDSLEKISGPVAAISAHGVAPRVEEELRLKPLSVIDATCPTVKKVQKAVQKLVKNGFYVVVFGDDRHAEVQGLLGYAEGQGCAALESARVFENVPWPGKIGLVSQTTQVPENYLEFVKELLDKGLNDNREISVLDTICREVRRRQKLTQELAARVDLMLVVGGRNSANSRRLMELCASTTETHLIQNAAEIDPAWLDGKIRIGITSGTSTSPQDIEAVAARLQSLTA
jgi:4-hydroxy-3-methylbut-2-en-1-yl diphosphate reductase